MCAATFPVDARTLCFHDHDHDHDHDPTTVCRRSRRHTRQKRDDGDCVAGVGGCTCCVREGCEHSTCVWSGATGFRDIHRHAPVRVNRTDNCGLRSSSQHWESCALRTVSGLVCAASATLRSVSHSSAVCSRVADVVADDFDGAAKSFEECLEIRMQRLRPANR